MLQIFYQAVVLSAIFFASVFLVGYIWPASLFYSLSEVVALYLITIIFLVTHSNYNLIWILFHQAEDWQAGQRTERGVRWWGCAGYSLCPLSAHQHKQKNLKAQHKLPGKKESAFRIFFLCMWEERGGSCLCCQNKHVYTPVIAAGVRETCWN